MSLFSRSRKQQDPECSPEEQIPESVTTQDDGPAAEATSPAEPTADTAGGTPSSKSGSGDSSRTLFMDDDAYRYLSQSRPECAFGKNRKRKAAFRGFVPYDRLYRLWEVLCEHPERNGRLLSLEEVQALVGFDTDAENGGHKVDTEVCVVHNERFTPVWWVDVQHDLVQWAARETGDVCDALVKIEDETDRPVPYRGCFFLPKKSNKPATFSGFAYFHDEKTGTSRVAKTPVGDAHHEAKRWGLCRQRLREVLRQRRERRQSRQKEQREQKDRVRKALRG